MSNNLLELFGGQPLNDILRDWHEMPLSRSTDAWIEFPPQDFLDFVEAYPKGPFDSIPESDNYLKPPSFLITQAHRLWLTASKVFRELDQMGAKRFIDLGSFPFFLPVLLRDYFGYKNEIIVTTNVDLSKEGRQYLDKKQIQVMKLDLDPFVSDPANNKSLKSRLWGTGRIPFELKLEKGTADFILSSHVIEHLYHPLSMVTECSRLLKPGGKLMITTDNAMMIGTFINYISGYGYIFEPIAETAAMKFNFWRGHVRFFTDKDLSTLVESAGFSTGSVEYNECFYEVFFEDYFKQPHPLLSGWKRRVLKDVPYLRNDITIIAVKN